MASELEEGLLHEGYVYQWVRLKHVRDEMKDFWSIPYARAGRTLSGSRGI